MDCTYDLCDPQSVSDGTASDPFGGSLDFEGQRSGPTVLLDAVFGVDQSEAALYPEVIDHLVADFVRAPRGVVRRPGRPDPPSGRSPRGPASLPPHHAPPHEPRAA